MSLSNGYTFEMSDISTSNSDFEALLAGKEASGSDSAIAELVSHIGAEAESLVSPPNSETHIAAAAAAVPEMTTPAPGVAARRTVHPRRLRRRMIILASVMGLLLATAGVGLAADGAAPGDPLYGLERALEKIGLNNGRAAERFDEAITLLNDGQPGLALGHAATTVATLPEQAQAEAAKNALEAAAVRVGDNEKAPDGVETLLLYLAGAFESGIDGQEVAALAQQIAGGSGQGSPPVGPPVGPPVVPPVVPPGPPVSTPGQSNVPGGG